MDIVILTPSYNRSNTLERLYKSLTSQTDLNFTWCVIDDGSTDDTKKLISKFMNEEKIEVKYFHQENGGKAKALNTGFSMVKEKCLFVIVDSDDYLHENAINLVKSYIKRYKEESIVGGFFFHYELLNGDIIQPKKGIIKEDKLMTTYDYYENFNKHDGCISYFSKVVEKYRYPEFPNEKYVGPTVLQFLLSQEYQIVYSPEIIGIAEYQSGGLTNRGRELRMNSPKGMIYYSLLQLSPKSSFKIRIKYAIALWPYAEKAGYSFIDVIKMSEHKTMLILSYLPGLLLKKIWSKK